MLPFRLFHTMHRFPLPLKLYSCGLHPQHTQYRPIGYPTLQCFICFSGTGTFQFQEMPYIKLKPNEILLVPSKLAHDYSPSSDSPWVLGYMGIEGDFAEPIVHSAQLPMLKPIRVEYDKMKILEEKLTKLWHTPDTYPDEQEASRKASIYIYDLLTYIRLLTVPMNESGNRDVRTTSSNAMLNAVKYMNQHYNEQLTIANIAHVVGYSKQHFQRRFKEMYGINPNLYLQRLRLEKSAELLEQQHQLSINEVAAMTGMESNYFIRLFKREYQITPAKYRASLKQ